jgi:uncharacterized protein
MVVRTSTLLKWVSAMVIRYVTFILGLAVMALGSYMTIEAHLGVSPWDSFHMGLQKTFGLTIGTWSELVGFIVVLLTYFIGKIKPGIPTVLNIIFFGLFLDLFIWIGFVPEFKGVLVRTLLFLAGVIVLAFGIGLYISPRLGAGPRDSFMLALHEKKGWSIQWVRICIEVTVLLLGWIFGGPVSVGTFLIAIFTGPLIQRTIPFWEKVMAPFYGTRSVVVTSTATPTTPAVTVVPVIPGPDGTAVPGSGQGQSI